MTQEEFLLDTLEYYTTDTSRRCVNTEGKCYYSPKNASTTGNGCAIGRHVPDQLKENMDMASNDKPVTVHSLFTDGQFSHLFDEFPAELKALGEPFLFRIQSLHDDPDDWSKAGLTDEGKISLHNIIVAFDMDENKFAKYIN